MQWSAQSNVGARRARGLAAALFCMLFLADWVSHTVLPHHADVSGSATVSTPDESHRHNHCGYFCRGEGHGDTALPSQAADAFQHNGTLAGLFVAAPRSPYIGVTKFRFPLTRVLAGTSAPVSPPPELA